MENLTAMPAEFTAGTTVTYRRSLPSYPASAWDLTVYLTGKSAYSVIATKDGDTFVVTIPANASIAAGGYVLTERVTGPSGRVEDATVASVTVRPDPATATPGSQQSWEEKMLQVFEDLIAGRLVKDVHSYQVDGLAVVKMDMEMLLKYRNQFKMAVLKQRGKFSMGTLINTTFTRG